MKAHAALNHARQCLSACDGWDEETLSHNVESNHPDVADDVREAVVRVALGIGDQWDRDLVFGVAA